MFFIYGENISPCAGDLPRQKALEFPEHVVIIAVVHHFAVGSQTKGGIPCFKAAEEIAPLHGGIGRHAQFFLQFVELRGDGLHIRAVKSSVSGINSQFAHALENTGHMPQSLIGEFQPRLRVAQIRLILLVFHKRGVYPHGTRYRRRIFRGAEVLALRGYLLLILEHLVHVAVHIGQHHLLHHRIRYTVRHGITFLRSPSKFIFLIVLFKQRIMRPFH